MVIPYMCAVLKTSHNKPEELIYTVYNKLFGRTGNYSTEERKNKKIWEQKRCLVVDHIHTKLLSGFDSNPGSIVYYVSLSKLITLYKPVFSSVK